MKLYVVNLVCVEYVLEAGCYGVFTTLDAAVEFVIDQLGSSQLYSLKQILYDCGRIEDQWGDTWEILEHVVNQPLVDQKIRAKNHVYLEIPIQ